MSLNHENFLGAFIAFFDHGLLLIEDSESEAAHYGWDAATDYVHFDHDSLYVCVRSVVDGPVTVKAYKIEAPASETAGMVCGFIGKLSSKFGITKIQDSDESVVFRIRGGSDANQLSVFFDAPNWAERVVVVIVPG